MYYLVIKNLEVEKCIDKNEDDIYKDNQYYHCNLKLDYVKKEFKRKIKINCIELPGTKITAIIYSD
jgi:hypothetical protein